MVLEGSRLPMSEAPLPPSQFYHPSQVDWYVTVLLLPYHPFGPGRKKTRIHYPKCAPISAADSLSSSLGSYSRASPRSMTGTCTLASPAPVSSTAYRK